VIKCGGTPAGWAVTGSALRAKTAGVSVIFEMAGGAVCGRTLE
jgi:hypothetical protein